MNFDIFGVETDNFLASLDESDSRVANEASGGEESSTRGFHY